MHKIIAVVLFFLFSVLSANSYAGGYSIELNIAGVESYQISAVDFVYQLGDKQFIADTQSSNKNNVFTFSADTTLPCGLYIFSFTAYYDNQEFKRLIEFVVPEGNQTFKFITDARDIIGKMKVEGSKENQLYFDYLRFLSICRHSNDSLTEVLKANNALAATVDAERKKLNAKVIAYQTKYMAANPALLSSKIIKSSIEPTIPVFTGTPSEVENARLYWYREHFFDNVDLTDPCLIYTPIMAKKVNYYLTNLVQQKADSINKVLNIIFNKASGNKTTLRFILKHCLDLYSKSTTIGLDASYVYIASNYYCNGKADWLSAESLNEICTKAATLEPLLIGKTAPDLTLINAGGSEQKISDIDADFIVFYFLPFEKINAPDLAGFATKYKDKGVKVVTICWTGGYHGDNCLKESDEDILPDNPIIHLRGESSKYDYNAMFALSKYTRIYILNRKHQIVFKQIQPEALTQTMERLLKNKN